MSSTPNDGLWNFARALYGSKGVGDACLQLQDESGVDVPVLLFALWLAANSVELTEAELVRIDSLIKGWREEVVRPLRTIRRRLKEGPHPAPSANTDALRNSIKAAELNSEKIELALLEAEGRSLMTGAENKPDVARRNAIAVIRHYREADLDEPGQQALDAILAAFDQL